MRDSPLIGRSRALTLIGGLVDRLAEGRTVTAGIAGAAGTGRTAVLEQALAAAADASTALASCAPDGVPFGAVTQLASALLPPARFADLVTACLDDPGRAAGRLCDAFAGLAAERPLVLAIDDLQWADEWSLRWFDEMAARRDAGGVLLIATAYEPPALDHRLVLPPLDVAETTELVRRVLGEVPADVLAAVLDVVRGRPAVLHDLAARWEPATARVLETGRAVTAARAARVRRGLPPDALALLRAMSVSERLDLGQAARLAGLASPAVLWAVGALEASGLVDHGRPAEPHLAPDVLGELTEAERANLHRRGAELAHRTGAGALVAAELLRAAPPVGEPWARTVLMEAAEQWSVQGDHCAAAEALQRALAEPASPPERAALLVRLASAGVRRDPDRADRRLVQILTEPELSGLPAAMTAADLVLARGDGETVHRVVAERESAPPGEESGVDGPGGAVVDPGLLALARLAREEGAVDPEQPIAPLLSGGPVFADPAEAGVAALRLAVRGEDRTRALDLAERALIVREDAPLVPRIAACRALLCCGDLASAGDGLGAVVAAARRRDARAAAALALVTRAAVALRDNRPEDALRDLTAAERELPMRCRHAGAIPTCLSIEITTHLRLGMLDRAHALAVDSPPAGRGHGAVAFLLHARAELALAEDDPETALAAASECGRILRARCWVNPMLALWRTTSGLALRRLGDREGAAALFAEELTLAERWGTGAALEALREQATAGLRRAVPAPRYPAGPPPTSRFAPPSPDALSPAERDVAELAARGLANREIAQELSIALRTVELRLTKVYRKLGLKGRSALTDHWTTRTPGASGAA